MEDTKHTFNVVFKMPLKSPDNPYEFSNVTTFNILPIYWTTMCVPGKGFIYGWTNMRVNGREIISACAPFNRTTSACALPTMIYSSSVILTGCTIFSASPIKNTNATYDR